MPKKAPTLPQKRFLLYLRQRVAELGGNITAAGTELGLKQAYASMLFNGVRNAGPEVIEAAIDLHGISRDFFRDPNLEQPDYHDFVSEQAQVAEGAGALPIAERHIDATDPADAVFAVLDDPRVAPVESEERAELRKVAAGFASRFGMQETVDHLVRWLRGHRLEQRGKPVAPTAAEGEARAKLEEQQRELASRGIVIQPKPRKR